MKRKSWRVTVDAKTPHRDVMWPRTITVNGPATAEDAKAAAIAACADYRSGVSVPLKDEEVISCHATPANSETTE